MLCINIRQKVDCMWKERGGMSRNIFKKIITQVEPILNDQKNIESVKKQKEDTAEIVFCCDLLSEANNRRNVFVTFRNLPDNNIDISYMCIINNYKNFPDYIGKELAMELTRKYRFVKAYFREENDNGENQFVGEYDCIFEYEKIESFTKSVNDISATVFSIMGDFVDLDQNLLWAFYENEQKKSTQKGEGDICINPNPFE